jgi:hypothetical protein
MKRQPLTLGIERQALGCAAIFGVAALGLGFYQPQSLAMASRLAVFACLAPAIGCTVFALIHRITGGQWSSGLAPFVRAGVAVMPWIWVVSIPFLLFTRKNYGSGFGYDGFPMVAVRTLISAALFFALRWALSDGVGSEQDARRNVRLWAGPVGLIALFFMLTFIADDWLESLETNWHSTAFTVVWIAGQAICGLALCILGALSAGARPSVDGSAGRPVGIDWGNLLLAAMMFWAYVSFAQFLIIWAGNLPEETSWYVRRSSGAWEYIIPAVALIGFAIPFFMLLSRRLKRSSSGIAWAASMLLAAQLAYLAWLIVPAQETPAPSGMLLEATLLAGSAALFTNRFLRIARKFGGEV